MRYCLVKADDLYNAWATPSQINELSNILIRIRYNSSIRDTGPHIGKQKKTDDVKAGFIQLFLIKTGL